MTTWADVIFFSVLSYKDTYFNSGGSWKKGNGCGNIEYHSYPHMIDFLEIRKPRKGNNEIGVKTENYALHISVLQHGCMQLTLL